MVVTVVRRTNSTLDSERKKRSSLIGRIIQLGRKNRRLGMFLFICYWYSKYGQGMELKRLWRFYNNISDHIVNMNTVRKQLELLRNKGLIEIRGDRIYPRVTDLEAAANLFDLKRSEAGKRGARKLVKKVLRKRSLGVDVSIPRNLDYYTRKVLEKASKLVRKGKKYEALDLLTHTLLPVRKTGVLWLWFSDVFVYYEHKVMSRGVFHSVRFSGLAEALRKLGFKEGLMVYHVFGRRYTGKILDKLFGKGHLSWPWGRSIFYGLKKLGIADEGDNCIIELKYSNGLLYLWIKDLYGNPIHAFKLRWDGELPAPLSENKTYFRTIVIGKQHIKTENEGSYFSKW